MMGKDFADKVIEYRIMNEHLMTKALALLKTADDLMVYIYYKFIIIIVIVLKILTDILCLDWD